MYPDLDALSTKIGDRRLGRAQQQGADVIGQHPIDLLGHASVEGAQSGFEVCDRDLQFSRRQGSGERRCRVARHEHQVRLFLDDDLL